MLCIKHNEIPLPSNFIYLIFLVAKRWYFYPLLSKCKENLIFIRVIQRQNLEPYEAHTLYPG